jgi:hypothetical protein
VAEPAVTPATDAGTGALSPDVPASLTDDSSATVVQSGRTAARASVRVAYVLGLAVQVLFWFLIFMAIAVAVGAGGHLTEFRYVGF